MCGPLNVENMYLRPARQKRLRMAALDIPVVFNAFFFFKLVTYTKPSFKASYDN